MVRASVGSHAQGSSGFKPVSVPRCARCLRALAADAKYCGSCRRKVVAIQIVAGLAILAVIYVLSRVFLSTGTAPPVLWVQ